MSDWIDDLKRTEDSKESDRQKKQEWKLRCDRLIAAKAPPLWRGLVERIRQDIARLIERFPDEDSKHLQFNDHNSDVRFTLSNPTKHRNFDAQLMADSRTISLHFRHRENILSAVSESHDEICFVVTEADEVQMAFAGRGDVSVISERLIKRLL